MQIGATLMTDSHNRFLGNRALSPETLMMGYGYDPFLSERSLKPPIFQTSTFVFRSAQDGKEFFELAYGLRQKRPNEEPGLSDPARDAGAVGCRSGYNSTTPASVREWDRGRRTPCI